MTEEREHPYFSEAEAPASLNFFGVTQRSWNVQITLRDGDENHLLDRFAKMVKRLEEMGVTPKPVGAQPPAAPAAPAVSPATPAPAPAAQAAPANGNSQHQTFGHFDGVFDAEIAEGQMSGGKASWKVKGGIYRTYGVTLWPEPLKAAGMNPDDHAGKNINLTGWRAYFINNDEGKPKKVIGLEKAA